MNKKDRNGWWRAGSRKPPEGHRVLVRRVQSKPRNDYRYWYDVDIFEGGDWLTYGEKHGQGFGGIEWRITHWKQIRGPSA